MPLPNKPTGAAGLTTPRCVCVCDADTKWQLRYRPHKVHEETEDRRIEAAQIARDDAVAIKPYSKIDSFAAVAVAWQRVRQYMYTVSRKGVLADFGFIFVKSDSIFAARRSDSF